jgi:hypothetical protein
MAAGGCRQSIQGRAVKFREPRRGRSAGSHAATIRTRPAIGPARPWTITAWMTLRSASPRTSGGMTGQTSARSATTTARPAGAAASASRPSACRVELAARLREQGAPPVRAERAADVEARQLIERALRRPDSVLERPRVGVVGAASAGTGGFVEEPVDDVPLDVRGRALRQERRRNTVVRRRALRRPRPAHPPLPAAVRDPLERVPAPGAPEEPAEQRLRMHPVHGGR